MKQNRLPEKFAATICPWKLPVHGDDASVFLPSKPLLVACDGSPAELALSFKIKAISYITALVRRHDDAVDIFASVVGSMIAFSTDNCMDRGSEDEGESQNNDIDEATDEVMEMLKSMQLLAYVGTSSLQSRHLTGEQTLMDILASTELTGAAKSNTSTIAWLRTFAKRIRSLRRRSTS